MTKCIVVFTKTDRKVSLAMYLIRPWKLKKEMMNELDGGVLNKEGGD